MMPRVRSTKKSIWTTHPETHPSDSQKIWAQTLVDTKRTIAYLSAFIYVSSRKTIKGGVQYVQKIVQKNIFFLFLDKYWANTYRTLLRFLNAPKQTRNCKSSCFN